MKLNKSEGNISWKHNYGYKEADIVIIIYRYDYFIISNEDDQTFGVYCGDRTGKKVLVTGRLVVIKFHSDRSARRQGFLMVFTAVSLGKYKNKNVAQACSLTLTMQENKSAGRNF